MSQQPDWERIRKHWWADIEPPSHWNPQIKPISMEGLGLLGIHQSTGDLYWDGKEIVIKRIISLGLIERCAIIAASLATVGLFLVELAKVLKMACT